MNKKSNVKGETPSWPSLEEQLKASKVRPGSALENHIRNNQDFSLLRPEEANDNLPFPPWLRVHWRKCHPELDFSGPRVGYPLILHNMWDWMMRNQDLPSNQSPSVPPDASSRTSGKPSHRS